jgi:hypothetical protein
MQQHSKMNNMGVTFSPDVQNVPDVISGTFPPQIFDSFGFLRLLRRWVSSNVAALEILYK